jgi:hypothetical protein
VCLAASVRRDVARLIVLTCIEGRYARFYQWLVRYQGSLRSSRFIDFVDDAMCFFSGGVFPPEAELLGRY